MNEPLVYIVIVNWNGYVDTLACINSLLGIKYKNYKIIIVDNGSTNGSAAKIRESFSQVQIIEVHENKGFAAGNNIGLKAAMDQGAEVVLFLNNDTEVDIALLTEMVNKLNSDEKIGAVGAKIYFAAEPIKLWWAGGKLNLEYGEIFNFGYGVIDADQFNQLNEVDYITGCCFMVKTAIMKQIGNWDESYFHTGEDVDLSMRIRNAGYKLCMATKAKVWHKISASGGGDQSGFYLYYLERNRLWLVKKYGHWQGFLSWIKLSPIITKRIISAWVKGKGYNSVSAVLHGYIDFIKGKTGKTLV